jgi:hypothetical protein
LKPDTNPQLPGHVDVAVGRAAEIGQGLVRSRPDKRLGDDARAAQDHREVELSRTREGVEGHARKRLADRRHGLACALVGEHDLDLARACHAGRVVREIDRHVGDVAVVVTTQDGVGVDVEGLGDREPGGGERQQQQDQQALALNRMAKTHRHHPSQEIACRDVRQASYRYVPVRALNQPNEFTWFFRNATKGERARIGMEEICRKQATLFLICDVRSEK